MDRRRRLVWALALVGLWSSAAPQQQIASYQTICPSQYAACQAATGCMSGFSTMMMSGGAFLPGLSGDTLVRLAACITAVVGACPASTLCGHASNTSCAAYAVCARGVNGSATVAVAADPPPPPPPECELNANTDCCMQTGQCPSSCRTRGHVMESVFGADGTVSQVQMCSCGQCDLAFPDGYPVDAGTWCGTLGFGSCGGECVPAGQSCTPPPDCVGAGCVGAITVQLTLSISHNSVVRRLWDPIFAADVGALLAISPDRILVNSVSAAASPRKLTDDTGDLMEVVWQESDGAAIATGKRRLQASSVVDFTIAPDASGIAASMATLLAVFNSAGVSLAGATTTASLDPATVVITGRAGNAMDVTYVLPAFWQVPAVGTVSHVLRGTSSGCSNAQAISLRNATAVNASVAACVQACTDSTPCVEVLVGSNGCMLANGPCAMQAGTGWGVYTVVDNRATVFLSQDAPTSAATCRFVGVNAVPLYTSGRATGRLLRCDWPRTSSPGTYIVSISFTAGVYIGSQPVELYSAPTASQLARFASVHPCDVGATGCRLVVNGTWGTSNLLVRLGDNSPRLARGVGQSRSMAVPMSRVAGSIDMSISLNGAQYVPVAPFVYLPTLSSISLNSGPTAGGTVLNVTGQGFSTSHGRIKCLFGQPGNTTQTIARYLAPDTVTCVTSEQDSRHMATVFVSVDDGAHHSATGAQFVFYEQPQFFGISPTSIQTGTDAMVAISASGMSPISGGGAVIAGLLPARSASGRTVLEAAVSCSMILAFYPESTSGQYWLATTLNGSPFPAYCDMVTDGGGWLVLSVVTAPAETADAWKQCTTDAEQYYRAFTGASVTHVRAVDSTSANITVTVQNLSYANPVGGGVYTTEQMANIRSVADELHAASIVTTTGSNDVTAIVGSSEYLLSPGVGTCGVYHWHSSLARSTVTGTSNATDSQDMRALPKQFLLPAQVKFRLFESSGGASFGWKAGKVMIRQNMQPTISVPVQQSRIELSAAITSGDFVMKLSLNSIDWSPDNAILNAFSGQVPPTLTLLTPSSGPKEGGSRVIVSGSNFGNRSTAKCRFVGSTLVGGTVFSDFLFMSGTQAECVSPPNGPTGATIEGNVDVSVTTLGSLWSSSTQFRYTATSVGHSTAAGPVLNINDPSMPTTVTAATVGAFTVTANTDNDPNPAVKRTSGGDAWYLNLQHCLTPQQCTSSNYGLGIVDMDPSFTVNPLTLIDVTAGANALTQASIQAAAAGKSQATIGTYTALFKTTISGLYSMSVSNGPFGANFRPYSTGSQPMIQGSPFRNIKVVPDSLHLQSSVFWGRMFAGVEVNSPITTEAGQSEPMPLQSRDQYGNNITDNALGIPSDSVSVSFIRCGDMAKNLNRTCTTMQACVMASSCSEAAALQAAAETGIWSAQQASQGAVGSTFRSTTKGQYVLIARVNGGNGVVNLPSHGAHVTVHPAATDGRQSLVTRSTLYVAGELAAVAIRTRDSFGNLREIGGDVFVSTITSSQTGVTLAPLVNVRAAATTQHTRPTVDHGDGLYALQFVPTVSGVYEINLRIDTSRSYLSMNGQTVDLPGQPVGMGSNGVHSLTVQPAILNVPSCTLSGADTIAGVIPAAFVQGRDRFSNNVTSQFGNFTCRLTCQSGQCISKSAAAVHGHSTYFHSGMHRVGFNATVAGSYVFTLSMSNCPTDPHCSVDIARPIPVVPASTAPFNSLIGGPGLGNTLAEDRTFITVHLRDEFDNTRSAGGEAQHLTIQPVLSVAHPRFWTEFVNAGVEYPEARKITDLLNGSYVIEYRFIPKGRYSLRVVYNTSVQWLVGKWWPSTRYPVNPFTVTSVGDLVTGYAPSIIKLPRPAPRVAWAKFDDSLVRIRIKFNVPTNKASMLAFDPCGLVVSVNLILALGIGPKCSWADESTLVVSLGSNSLVKTTASYYNDAAIQRDTLYNGWNGMVTLALNRTLGLYQNTHPVQGEFNLSDPVNKISPVAVIRAKLLLGLCDDATISASQSYGAGPRYLRHEWSTPQNGGHNVSFSFRCRNANCYFFPALGNATCALIDRTYNASCMATGWNTSGTPQSTCEGRSGCYYFPTQEASCVDPCTIRDVAQCTGTCFVQNSQCQSWGDAQTTCNGVKAFDSQLYTVLSDQTLDQYLSASSSQGSDQIGSTNLKLGSSDLFPGTQYSFTLKVTNMLDLTDTATVVVSKLNVTIPNIEATRPVVRSFRSESLILSTFAELPKSKPGCIIPAAFTQIDYSWRGYKNPPLTPLCSGSVRKARTDPTIPFELKAILEDVCEGQSFALSGEAFCESSCAKALRYELGGCTPNQLGANRTAYSRRLEQCEQPSNQQLLTFPVELTVDADTFQSKDLLVPYNTLDAYYSYNFVLDAWLRMTPDEQNQIQVNVSVDADQLQAKISGGNRIVGQTSLLIDARGIDKRTGLVTTDPSGVAGETYYIWSCHVPLYPIVNGTQIVDPLTGNTSGPCLDRNNNLSHLIIPNVAVHSIPPDTLLIDPFNDDGIAHLFTVSLRKVSFVNGLADERTAAATVTLMSVPGARPDVRIDVLRLAKANPSEKLVLTATVTSNTTTGIDSTQWFVLAGQLDLNDPLATTTGRMSNNLVVVPGYLVPGQTYQMRLTAIDANGPGYSEIEVIVNQAPSSGSFAVDPIFGNAVQTVFNFYTNSPTMSAWADDIEDMPLKYRFTYSFYHDTTGELQEGAIGQLQPSPNKTVQLPIGDMGEQECDKCCAGLNRTYCEATHKATGCYNMSCLSEFLMWVNVYPTDKYEAAAKASFLLTVIPPNITTDSADFTSNALNSTDEMSITRAQERGDLDAVSQASGALIDVVNRKANKTATRRLLGQDNTTEDEAQRRIVVREQLLDIVVGTAEGSAKAGTFFDANLATASALTQDACEVGDATIGKSSSFVTGLVTGADKFGASTANDAGATISSLYQTSTPAAKAAKCSPPPPPVSVTRRRALLSSAGVLNDLINSSCTTDCGNSSGLGRCVHGACHCNHYNCNPGRCYKVPYIMPSSYCSVAEDMCVNTSSLGGSTAMNANVSTLTCYNFTCGSGYCSPNSPANCMAGICVSAPNGVITCYPKHINGICTSDYRAQYTGPSCNITREAKLTADIESRRARKCLTEGLHGTLNGVSNTVLNDVVVGEAPLAVGSDGGAFKMSSTKVDPAGIGGGLAPPASEGVTQGRRMLADAGMNDCAAPRFVLPPSALAAAGEKQERQGVAAQVVAWDVDPFAFSQEFESTGEGEEGVSGELSSKVASLSLDIDTQNLADPVVVYLPRTVVGDNHTGSSCRSNRECNYPSGTCANMTNVTVPPGVTELRGTCQCVFNFEGAKCDQEIRCKYWDFAAETWSSKGCIVVNVTTSCTQCHCSHLTDFASAADEWVPQLNLPNPADMDIVGTFMADPRNIVILAILLSMYIFWIYFCITGYRKDQEERHQHYMGTVVEKMQRVGGIRWLGAVKPQETEQVADEEAVTEPAKWATAVAPRQSTSAKAISAKDDEVSSAILVESLADSGQSEGQLDAMPEEEEMPFKLPKEGAIELMIDRAHELKDVAAVGRMDPFCEVIYAMHHSKEQRHHSRTRKHAGRTPHFRDRMIFQVVKNCTTLDLELWDADVAGADEFIGRGKVDLLPFFKSPEHSHTLWVKLSDRHANTYNGEVMLHVKYTAQQRTGFMTKVVFCARWFADIGPKMWDSMKENHPWISCIFVDPDEEFTRPQRVTILMAVILGNFCIAAILLETPPCLPTNADGTPNPGYPDCAAYEACNPEDHADVYPDCPEEEEDEGCDATCWKQMFTTIVIISVILLPCDRTFIFMFEKMQADKKSRYGRGPGGRVWDLPEVPREDTTAITHAQSLIRGFLVRRKHRRAQQARRMFKTHAWTAGVSSGSMRGLLAPPLVDSKIRTRLYPRHVDQTEYLASVLPGTANDSHALEKITLSVTGEHTPYGKAVAKLRQQRVAPPPETETEADVRRELFTTGAVAPGATVPLTAPQRAAAAAGGGGGGGGDSAPSQGGGGAPARARPLPRPPPGRSGAAGAAGGAGGSSSSSVALVAVPPPMPAPPAGSRRRSAARGEGGAAGGAPPPAFMRRRAFPMSAAQQMAKPQVLAHYDQSLQYILTDHEQHLLVRVQAACRGFALRARLRRGWYTQWRAGAADRIGHAKRRLKIVALVVGTIQMHRGRYARRRRRMERKAAKGGEEEEDEEEVRFPPWFKYVAWGSVIGWCLLCGFYTFILGLLFGPVATLDWLFGSFGALGWEGCVQDTFKIFVVVMLADQAEMLVDYYYEFMDFMPCQI
jgi:hypothetical protein